MKLDDYDAVGARQKQMAGSGTSVKDGKPNRLESATVMEYLRSHGYAKALGALKAELEASEKGASPAKSAEERDAHTLEPRM